MKCHKCGHEIPDGNEYCQFCGLKIDKMRMKDVIEEIMPDDEDGIIVKEKEDNSIEQADSDSVIGSAIKVFSVIIMILGVIGAIALVGALGVGIAVVSGVINLLVGMLCYGIGEICCLLKSINAKMK